MIDNKPTAIFAYVHHNRQYAALVELSAQTDFALRTELLENLGNRMAMQFAAETGFEGLGRPWLLDPSKSVQQIIAETSNTLGETIEVVRWSAWSTDHRCLK